MNSMSSFTILLPFILFLASSVLMALWAKKRPGHSDFFLGGRSLGVFPLVMTFLGTQIGGGFILGTADSAFRQGILGIGYPLGLALGFLGLGTGFGAKLRSLELNTISELFSRVYESKKLYRFSSILLLCSLFGILIALAIGMKEFLVALGFTSPAWFLLSWFLVLAYTTQGGFLTVVWTDVVQAVAMIFLLSATFLVSWFKVPDINWVLPTSNISTALPELVMPALFMFIGQDMAQRCLAAKTPEQATKATKISALILTLLAFIPVWFGVVGRKLGADPAQGSIFLQAVHLTTNPVIFSFAASSVLLAIVSTVSSILLAISSSLSFDLLKGRFGRSTTFATGAFALVGTLFASDIIGCMVASYELSAAILAAPIFAAIYATSIVQGRKHLAWIGVICGGTAFILQKIFGLSPLLPLAISGTVTAFLVATAAQKNVQEAV